MRSENALHCGAIRLSRTVHSDILLKQMRPHIALASFLLLLGCSSPSPQRAAYIEPSEPVKDGGGEEVAATSKEITCDYPYRADLGRPFVVVVRSKPLKSSDGPVLVTMTSGQDVKYDPPSFKLRPGQRQLVNVTVRSSRSGLAEIVAFPNDTTWDFSDVTVNVGYQGHLKLVALALPYNEPQSLNVQIVDNNEKPLPADLALSMELQSVDARLRLPKTPDSKETVDEDPITLEVPLGSTSSLPFSIRSLNRKGTPIHLLATLKKGSMVLAQNVFTLDTQPVWWLPIVLAIGGAALYGSYSIIKEPDLADINARSTAKRLLQAFSVSVLAGTIAYLFADFDLLGLKLDPHVLRTYPLLGFLFSFVGVDTVLSRRYRGSRGGNHRTGIIEKTKHTKTSDEDLSSSDKPNATSAKATTTEEKMLSYDDVG